MPNMTSAVPGEGSAGSGPLLQQVAFLGARPFANQVVQSPWNAVVDSPTLHHAVKQRIRTLVSGCAGADASRCLTVLAPAGYGKTHLLAWTRQMIEERGDAVFVHVPPYLPGTPGGVSMEQHVMRAAVDALWSRSRRQQAAFEQAFRTHLTTSYDRIVETGALRSLKETLRAGTFWSRLFRRSRLRIGALGVQDQLTALQRSFQRRTFLDDAFADLMQQHSVGADGVRPDRDAFVAGALLTCGDTRQRWHADRWLHSDRIPLDVLEPFHIDHPCQGTEKIRNGLFTLQRIVGQSFCLAFDQMEDTYGDFNQSGSPEAKRFVQTLGVLLRNLSVMPGFCLIFCCQLSVWQEFAKIAPPMLLDRMVEGDGPLTLSPLDDPSAQDLIQERMKAAVWNLLTVGPAANEPCFPFTAAEVRDMRLRSGGELRAFLQRAQQEYDARLATPSPLPPSQPMRLRSVEPREVLSHESTAVLIRAENLPSEVRVFFADQPTAIPPVCRSALGEIDLTTPVGPLGDIEIRVEDLNNSKNADRILLRFRERPVPRPYQQHLDGGKLKARREELELTQKQVAEEVKSSANNISRVEREVWKYAPDDLYMRLAEVYKQPLSTFLKKKS